MPIEDFPPFYTRQPNESTWQEQRQQWIQSILARAQQYKIWSIDDQGNIIQSTPTDAETPANLFSNQKINRKLDSDTIKEILLQMQRLNLVRATGSSKKKSNTLSSELLILWNTPDQWASLLLEWVERTGQLGTILTLFEIQNVKGELFEGINEELLKASLEVLCRGRGRGVILKDASGEVVGVKIE